MTDIVDGSTLDGSNGFEVQVPGGYGERIVAGLGDINGDGVEDFAVSFHEGTAAFGIIVDENGDWVDSPPDPEEGGVTYVVFGSATGFPADFSASLLDGSNGFVIDGDLGQLSGWAISGLGDVNGDGVDDFILGAPTNGMNPGDFGGPGSAYVVYGSSTGFDPLLNLEDIDGTNGFRVDGLADAAGDGERVGYDVASAGDVNGDGIFDIVIGLPGANYWEDGGAVVIFGRADSDFDATLLAYDGLDGTNGFRIDGIAGSIGWFGTSVSSAGDINGDNIDDVVVGAPAEGPDYAGGAYVIFGDASGFAANLNVADLDGSNGFRIAGVSADDFAGNEVSSLGDINGDGFDDIALASDASNGSAAKAGRIHVIYGSDGGFAPVVDLAALDATGGFIIAGVAAGDLLGRVASAGDVNGDGIADMIVGASLADPHGAYDAGSAYVIYGRDQDFGGSVDLAALTEAEGFRINGPVAGYDFHLGVSVAGAGDVNDDGFDDVIVSGNGTSAYLVYGAASPAAAAEFVGTENPDVFTAPDNRDWTISGLADDDVLTGAGGNDIINGGAGNDMLDGGLGNDAMSGGLGNDTYEVDDSDDSVTEEVNEGIDRVLVSLAAFTLGDDVENLRGMVDTGQTLTGNGLNNAIDAGNGNDILDGGSGNDRLRGNDGDDTYYVDGSGDKVFENMGEGQDVVYSTVSFSLAGQYVERLDLTGVGNINATGNGQDNVLNGNDGNNRLNGGIGADMMTGGLGNDQYVIDSVGDQVIEGVDGGTDRVESRLTYSLAGLANVENLFLTGLDQINATGNALDNEIHGNDAGNIIDGGAGADTMIGGKGNDRYIVDSLGEIITEFADGGFDTVESSVTLSVAGKYIEVLKLTGTADINGTGNGQAETIIGNSGANVINAAGNDDKLFGGDGNDTLTGGSGSDRFIFDTALGGSNVDDITDFSAVDDSIYLQRSIFVGANVGALNASSLYVGAAAHDANDRIVYDKDTGNIFYDSDGNNAGAQILFATVDAGTILTAADFIGF